MRSPRVATFGNQWRNRFKAAGAPVEFYPIPGGNHQTSVAPMMLNALSWFQSLN